MFGKRNTSVLLKTKKMGLAAVALFATMLFSGCGTSQQASYTVNLEIWGVFDDSTTYAEIINQYKKINPYVGEIKYRKFSQDTYSRELLDALAAGQGPDIFLIGNSWLPSYENKLAPAPTPLVSEQDVKNSFPDVVDSDFVDGGKVYAVPLSVDSMQLYYNKDLFNTAGITTAPKTWQEFKEDVKKLTIVDSTGNVLQSGAAIGTAQNVNRASDLLSLLMFQNGVEMPTDKNSQIKFDQGSITADGSVVQASQQALGFYTDFARVSTSFGMVNPYYTWNNRQHNSSDAFAEGRVAMMFNYSWQIAAIKSKNPKLNFGIAPVPQINQTKPIDVANYWGYAVAKNKVDASATTVGTPLSATPVTQDMRTHEAWQFLKFLTLKNNKVVTLYNAITKNSKDFPIDFDPAYQYLQKTQQPAARRDLIDAQKTDPVLSVFASGNLIAKHWYQYDPNNVDNVFSDVIESVVRGEMNLHDALTLAKNRISYSSSGGIAR